MEKHTRPRLEAAKVLRSVIPVIQESIHSSLATQLTLNRLRSHEQFQFGKRDKAEVLLFHLPLEGQKMRHLKMAVLPVLTIILTNKTGQAQNVAPL